MNTKPSVVDGDAVEYGSQCLPLGASQSARTPGETHVAFTHVTDATSARSDGADAITAERGGALTVERDPSTETRGDEAGR